MAIFDFEDYKEYLKAHVKQYNLRFAAIADAAGMQRTFVSMVLNGDHNFNEQQAYDVAIHLGLGSEETEYFILLVQDSRAGKKDYKAYLHEKILVMQRVHGKLSGKLSERTALVPAESHPRFFEYYLNPLNQAVHMFLVIPKYQRSVTTLSQRLGLDPGELKVHIELLLRLGVIEKTSKGFETTIPFLHIDSTSPLSRQNHINSRISALKKEFSSKDDDYRFTALFAANAATKRKFGKKMKALIAEFQKDLAGIQPDDVYGLNIDLFGC